MPNILNVPEGDNNPFNFFKIDSFKTISAIVGVLLISIGAFIFLKPLWEGPTVEVLEASSSGQISTSTITVEISGAVEKPGVYEILASDRVERLLIMSGGLSATVDHEWIAKNLNRAAKLTDGQKIYIPKTGETTVYGPQSTAGKNSAVVGSLSSVVNLNSASTSELDSLPGIGEVRAEAIIANRPYSSVEELLTKKVIPKNVYEDIKGRVMAP